MFQNFGLAYTEILYTFFFKSAFWYTWTSRQVEFGYPEIDTTYAFLDRIEEVLYL